MDWIHGNKRFTYDSYIYKQSRLCADIATINDCRAMLSILLFTSKVADFHHTFTHDASKSC